MTVGGVISGYCEIGRLLTVMRPTSTIIIASTVANIGRSMKNLENISLLSKFVIEILWQDGYFTRCGLTVIPSLTLRRALVTYFDFGVIPDVTTRSES